MPDDNAITTYDPMMKIDVEAPSEQPYRFLNPLTEADIKQCIDVATGRMLDELIASAPPGSIPLLISPIRERIRQHLTSFQTAIIDSIFASANKAEKELDEIVFPSTDNLSFYDLRPSTKLLYPITTPLRRSIPRRKKTKKNV